MQHPKDTFCDVFLHAYTPFFRDHVISQKPYTYSISNINFLRCFCVVFLLFLSKKTL